MSSEFGVYRVSYTPTSDYDTAYVEPTINMSISGEANLDQMLSFFDSFLKASGYVYEGNLEVVEPKKSKLDNTISVGEPRHGFYPSPWYGSTVASGISGSACPNTDAVAIGIYNPWEK